MPRDLSQDFSIFPDRIPVGFYPWSRSYLGPAYARIAEASTSFPVLPEGPDSVRRVSPSRVSDPFQGGPIGCSPPHAPLEGSFHVWPWGSLDTPPKGVVPRYPPRGVLRDCSRPVPGSCRGVVSPLTGGFPHNCNAGYWQIPVAEEGKHLTTFTTQVGTYQCTRLPFGLCHAPATFQRPIDVKLAGVEWQYVLVY